MNKRVREALFVYAEGRSQISGEPLTDWNVDHLVPRSAGGSDDITNLQALTRTENHVKSDAMPPELRGWQQLFVDKWNRSQEPSFLLVALPGSGKTIAALTVAYQWQRENPRRRRILVVVPTDPLRKQWKDEAVKFGLNFQTKEFPNWKAGMVGAVITYHLVPNHDLFWKLTCRDFEVLAILDEVHHAGTNNTWGRGLQEALTGATRRLLTSGTPFRGDATRIPFVRYDATGRCIPDDHYDYPTAIRDGVIRVVKFQHESGIVRHIDGYTGAIEAHTLTSDVEPDEESDTALSRILTPGQYTDALLRLAHQRLLEVRERGLTHAAGLVICKDQNHAEGIARQLATITGRPPDVVISDDERATSTVDDFRDSDRPWVVAVKKISEGVDIRRLIVLAYLTHCKTPLFFRQAVGRIVRNMGTDFDGEAYCFIPDHPLLVQHAQQIAEAQYDAIVNEPDDEEETADSIRRRSQLFMDAVLDTEHTGTAGTIIEGQVLDPALATRIAEAARRHGCTEALALKLYLEFGISATLSMPITGPGRPGHQRPLEDQLDSKRRRLHKSVARAVILCLPDDTHGFKKGNRVVNRHIGKVQRRDFTLIELDRAIAFVASVAFTAALRREP